MTKATANDVARNALRILIQRHELKRAEAELLNDMNAACKQRRLVITLAEALAVLAANRPRTRSAC